jgi:hypothetical protein
VRARPAAEVGHRPGGATTFASSSAIRLTSSRCSGSSRRRSQAAFSRSCMNRKNHCGALMAATLWLADVRLLAGDARGVPRCLIGRWQAQNETPSDEQPSGRTAPCQAARRALSAELTITERVSRRLAEPPLPGIDLECQIPRLRCQA